RQRFDWLEKAGHYECADLEVVRVRIRSGTREMAETTVSITARERPTRRSLDSSPTIGTRVPKLPQRKDRVECRMAVARGHVEQPAPVGLLVTQHALDDFVRHWRRLSDEAVVVGRVKSRCDVIV